MDVGDGGGCCTWRAINIENAMQVCAEDRCNKLGVGNYCTGQYKCSRLRAA